MKLEMARQAENVSVSKVCEIFGISRSNYYRKVFGMADYRVKEREEAVLLTPEQEKLMKELCLKNPEYGHKKIQALMQALYGEYISRYRIYRRMGELGLLLPVNYTEEIRGQMTARKEYLHKPEGINQLWQMDFTEFEISGYGTYYATNVKDYYSRFVLATLVRPSHTADELKDGLDLAQQEAMKVLGEDCFPEETILVIDNGPAMKAKRFKKYLTESRFRKVYARGHHPQTLGMLERFHESQKYERIYRREYQDPIEAGYDLEQYRKKYNYYRPHQALNYRVPAELYTKKNLVDYLLNTR